MKTTVLLAFTLLGCSLTVSAQEGYFVKTQQQASAEQSKEAATTPEEDFINANFRYYSLCDWQPGMKFMVLPERKDLIIPTFKSKETGKNVSSGDLKYKIFEYLGVEETEQGFIHFLFDCENKTYYHEVKNTSLGDYCSKPKAGINTLAFLGDVDIAKDLLVGETLYTRAEKYRIDDNNAAEGYKEIEIPDNTKVTVVGVGIGSRSFPVKIVVKDEKGREYYQSVAISKTNCGMVDTEFIMDLKSMWFPNSFAFNDANKSVQENLKEQYAGKDVYLKESSDMISEKGPKRINRYRQFVIKDIEAINNSPYVKMTLLDLEGNTYTKEITFKRTSVAGDIAGEHENFFTDVFGQGNLRSRYPKIDDNTWELISKGEIKLGMSPDACRMAKGNPLRVHKNHEEAREDWFYEDHSILTFKHGKLAEIN